MLSPSWTFRDIHKIQGRSSSNSGYKIQKICGWKYTPARAPLAREYTKSNIRVERWHKYENSELDWETQFLFHFILLNKFNRTEIQTYKVEERTFGHPLPVWYSNQLSYETTAVGSWSIMCSYVPVKDMNVIDVYEINHIRTAEMKSNEEWSSQLWTQFMQPHTKIQDFNEIIRFLAKCTSTEVLLRPCFPIFIVHTYFYCTDLSCKWEKLVPDERISWRLQSMPLRSTWAENAERKKTTKLVSFIRPNNMRSKMHWNQ